VRNLVAAALLGPGLLALTASCVAPAPAGRLMLNNFSFDPAAVQVVLAGGPDCTITAPGAVTEFVLPPNATRIIPAPPGFDVCWRREPAAAGPTGRPPDQWTAWSRAYTGSGRFLDAVVEVPPPPRVVATLPQTPVSAEPTPQQLLPK
jgi:hypothetical protein